MTRRRFYPPAVGDEYEHDGQRWRVLAVETHADHVEQGARVVPSSWGVLVRRVYDGQRPAVQWVSWLRWLTEWAA